MTDDEAAAERLSRELAEQFRIEPKLPAAKALSMRLGRIAWLRRIKWLRRFKARFVDPFLGTRRAELPAVAASHEQHAKLPGAHDILCLPIIDWDFRFQRPQQLMTRFAAAGHRVFYVRRHFRPFGPPWKITPKAHNVYEVSLRGPAVDLYTASLDERACALLFESLNALRRDLSFGATAMFVQLPSWWPLARKMRETFGWPLIYDCMDHHAGFSGAPESASAEEQDMLAGADLVIASSANLEEYARAHAGNVLLARNACDYEHFASVTAPKNARPVIGYYGAIADWFDSELVADLAERHPEWDFLLIGSTYLGDVARLAQLPNVRLPGEQPYESLPEWLAGIDVAILPFRRTPLTEATNPVKVYEMLAAGKAVVSVPIPEVAALAPLVRLASTAEEFASEISRALLDDAVAERRELARQRTWEERRTRIAAAVHELFPRVSIVIVTYNNLELNRLCLEALYARTEWPDFEVIVVDNGSHDGTAEYLRDAPFPNLRTVLRYDNAGFAAACNIGLRLATGRFLLLLNNDTVVSRGWLSALVRHLQQESSIGMIGPVTNAIDNNARVRTGYDGVDDMPRWAASYVREHDGRTVPMPMLAMFCVAMRREVWEEIGPLDERFTIGMFEDDDYSRRVRERGYGLATAHDSFIHHWQQASFKLLGRDEYLRLFQENRARYIEKWHDDPAAVQRPAGAPRIEDVIARVRASRGAVILLPSIGWHVHLVQRTHHLARTFARKGFVVVYDCSNAQDPVDGFAELEPNLFLYRGDTAQLARIPDPIVWALPYNFHLAAAFGGAARTVYDWIDDLAVFPYKQRFLRRVHRRGIAEATIVAAVARVLHAEALRERPDAILLPNAVEYERFASGAHAVPSDVPAGKPIAGYYGALADWFDFDLLDEVAQRRPDWNFLLIGAPFDDAHVRHPLFSRENVTWLGTRPYEQLPAYLQAFDVALIPFLINDVTNATSPLKLYEYFASGKAVVSTPMAECVAIGEVEIAATAEAFTAALDAARTRGEDEGFRDRVREIARTNSWDARADAVLALLDEKAGASLPPAAREVAQRFARFRTRTNTRFFNALGRHYGTLADHPVLSRYFEFSVTTNERGRSVADLLAKRRPLAGKRYLDVGCAYGGFLVAFAERGCEVAGIDYDPSLLALARENLADHGLDAPLLRRDAIAGGALDEWRRSIDVVTCNDVIEHVDDPELLMRNVAGVLREGGIVYLEIPNRATPQHVLADGHYELFGITLLDRGEASEYFAHVSPGVPYGVGDYLSLPEYEAMFARHGLSLEVLDESVYGVSVRSVLAALRDLRRRRDEGLPRVPEPLRARVAERLDTYLREVEQQPRRTDADRRAFVLHYGAGFWKIVAKTPGASLAKPPRRTLAARVARRAKSWFG